MWIKGEKGGISQNTIHIVGTVGYHEGDETEPAETHESSTGADGASHYLIGCRPRCVDNRDAGGRVGGEKANSQDGDEAAKSKNGDSSDVKEPRQT